MSQTCFALLLLALFAPTAYAEPAEPGLAVGLNGALSAAEPRLAAQARWRTPSSAWLGAELRLGDARALYLDGWPVSEGRTLTALIGGSAPLTSVGGASIDLQVAGGLRTLSAEVPTPDEAAGAVIPEQSWGWLVEVTPMATLPVGDRGAAQLGWTAIYAQQRSPRAATETLGQVLVGGYTLAVTDDVQVHLRMETGGLYGFDGDGAKVLARGTVGVRLVPGQAASWLNH
ncbi:hypothetical protein L6R49_12640 [Myxococcota bacterium]|nr:hypothetical protein [Myxococcota bacterium]